MVFSEPRFLAFFVVVFALHWALRANAARKLLLLAASLFFYGCWDWRFLGLIVGCSTVDYIVGRGLHAAHARGGSGKGWLWLSLTYNLGSLAFFK